MPSIRTVEPTATPSRSPSPNKKDRVVGFNKDPVVSVSRPVSPEESWPAYHFEMHARKCAYCHRPYEVHRNNEQLCDVGHRLAQAVSRHIYNKSDGETYSIVEEDNKLVRVEIPASYVEVAGLLKALERSLRRRSRQPIISMDRTYYVAPRSLSPRSMSSTLPQRSRSVKVEQDPAKTKRPRPRSGEIVDWPELKTKPKRVLTEISNTPNSKRGSLYEEDLAKLRRTEKQYAVEVREPSPRGLRAHRVSSYYR